MTERSAEMSKLFAFGVFTTYLISLVDEEALESIDLRAIASCDHFCS